MIMNNNVILANREQKTSKSYNLMMTAIERPLTRITLHYSEVLERKLDTRQTLCLLNAQIAFIMTVFPIDCSFLLRILCGCWLVNALLKCKKNL